MCLVCTSEGEASSIIRIPHNTRHQIRSVSERSQEITVQLLPASFAKYCSTHDASVILLEIFMQSISQGFLLCFFFVFLLI